MKETEIMKKWNNGCNSRWTILTFSVIFIVRTTKEMETTYVSLEKKKLELITFVLEGLSVGVS